MVVQFERIEWPNFVESPKKWVENTWPIQNIGIGAFGRA
jgi:hypothetical protein